MDHQRIIAAGQDMAPLRHDGTPTSPADWVWALTEEAARVFNCGVGPGPRGYPSKSAMPEAMPDVWELFSVQVAQIGEGIDQERARVRFVPTAAQISRAEVLQRLWMLHAFPRVSKRREMLMAVWLMAAGVPGRKVKAMTGLSSDQRRHARERGSERVAIALGAEKKLRTPEKSMA